MCLVDNHPCQGNILDPDPEIGKQITGPQGSEPVVLQDSETGITQSEFPVDIYDLFTHAEFQKDGKQKYKNKLIEKVSRKLKTNASGS
jgi:hypothetical protein